MSKKVSAEGKIMDAFESFSLPEARVMFNMLARRLSQREVAAAPPAPVKVKKTVVRRTKAQIAAAAETAKPAATQPDLLQ
jgi:hypothetical protein